MRVPQHILIITLLLALLSCSQSSGDRTLHQLSGATMGTTFTVKLISSADDFNGIQLQADIESLLAILEQRFSTYRPESELSRINVNQSIEAIAVSTELCGVVAEALRLSAMTAGAFDITVGPLVNLWGFGPDVVAPAPPDDDALSRAMATVGYQKLHVDCAVPSLQKDFAELRVDLSAFVKGYAVDQLAALLEDRGVADYLVEIGGELRVRGHNVSTETWAIGIESPSFTNRSVQFVIDLSNTGIATSGDYRNYFEFDGRIYSHTIDPVTGSPVLHSGASVTVINKSAAFADAMATALLVLGPEAGFELAEREGIAAIFLSRGDAGLEERVTGQFAMAVARQ